MVLLRKKYQQMTLYKTVTIVAQVYNTLNNTKATPAFAGPAFMLWAMRDSNPRPSACKADALNQLS
jgi:hypothetical protein